MRLAVASGKGGTGKTLVSTSLAWHLARAGQPVTYVDADVEAPNGHLFLHPEGVEESRATVQVPVLRNGTCSGCGACQEVCAFNAILALKDRVMVFPELCHGCGACVLACAEVALTETRREMGTLRHGTAPPGINFWSAVLDVGEAMAPPLIEALFAAVDATPGSGGVTVIDAPPGTSCSAMAVVRGADKVLLVTEPTPFGLHDLELAVQMCQALGKPVLVVLNRADLGDRRVHDYLAQQSVPLVAEIPYSREVAQAYASGELAGRAVQGLHGTLEQIARAVLEGAP